MEHIITAVAVNHISCQVKDYTKTRDWYSNLLGMKVSGDNGRQCNLTFGDHGTWLLPRNAREGVTAPHVDTENSFHVKDPDGFDVQKRKGDDRRVIARRLAPGPAPPSSRKATAWVRPASRAACRSVRDGESRARASCAATSRSSAARRQASRTCQPASPASRRGRGSSTPRACDRGIRAWPVVRRPVRGCA